MPDIDDYKKSKKFTGIVRQSNRITPSDQDEVRQITIQIDQWSRIFEDGRNIGVFARGPESYGSPLLFRLYSIAGVTGIDNGESALVDICVKRCFYYHELSDEKFPGVVSNYLCDLTSGDPVELSGPFGWAFAPPKDNTANLIMIGQGTGIAPFRGFAQRIEQEFGEWKGKTLLFHGARSGMELLYMNDEQQDLANYFDKETYEAIKVLSPRPHFNEPIAFESALMEKKQELWELLQSPNTYVYLAGSREMEEQINSAFETIAGSDDKWQECKADLIATEHWDEVFY